MRKTQYHSCCRKYSTICSQNTQHRREIIQPKTQIKLGTNREIPRSHGAGEKNKVTVATPLKKPKAPTPASREHPKRKGKISGGLRKKLQKLVGVSTTASNRPKSNNGMNTSLNEDALVPPSAVDSDQSHYSSCGSSCASSCASAYASSDGTIEYKSSEEEGKAIKILATDMMEQTVKNERSLIKKRQ
jgi:hypothetical protein